MSKNIEEQANPYRIEEGVAYTSISEGAKLVGVTYETLRAHILTKKINLALLPHNGREIRYIRAKKLAQIARYYAEKGNSVAKELLEKTADVGMTTYFYGAAGVELPTQTPVSKWDTMRNHIDQLEALEKVQEAHEKMINTKASNERVEALEKSVRNNQCPRGYLPKRKLALCLEVPYSKGFVKMLDEVRSVEYPFTSGNGGIRRATAYNIEDMRVLLES